MALANDDDVIKTFLSDRADQPLRPVDRECPWPGCAGWRQRHTRGRGRGSSSVEARPSRRPRSPDGLRDQNSPATTYQINLRRSPIAVIIDRFAGDRQLFWVYGRYTRHGLHGAFSLRVSARPPTDACRRQGRRCRLPARHRSADCLRFRGPRDCLRMTSARKSCSAPWAASPDQASSGLHSCGNVAARDWAT
jgi:hypothetical protein